MRAQAERRSFDKVRQASDTVLRRNLGTTVRYSSDREHFRTHTHKPEYEIPNMYECEDRAFLDSTVSGEKTRSNIDNVLESAKLLDVLYKSAGIKREIEVK